MADLHKSFLTKALMRLDSSKIQIQKHWGLPTLFARRPYS